MTGLPQKHQTRGQDLRVPLAHQAPAKPSQNCADQRREKDYLCHGLAFHHVNVFDVDGPAIAEEHD